MARIAEDLFLLQLDDGSTQQPRLDRSRLGRVMAAALLLDLAYDRRVRPALAQEPMPAGHLVALAGEVPLDPAVRPALALLQQGPITPAAAIGRLRKRAEDDVLDQLLRTGTIHQVQLSAHRLRRNSYAWPVRDRGRAEHARAGVRAALFDQRSPGPVSAAIIALLHAVNGLGEGLGLNAAGTQRAGARAHELADGRWADPANTAEVNLAVTAAAVLPALG